MYGEFHLSEANVEYFAGFYEIRAYTKTMLNFGEEVEKGKVSIRFYNNSFCRKINICAKGITKNGNDAARDKRALPP
jgi:hypothetical protein